jgi:hypothetical protein
MIKKPGPIGLKTPNPSLPFCWLTEEQWINIMFSIVGISPYESQDPDDMTEYPIPDGEEILKYIRTNQKCPVSSENPVYKCRVNVPSNTFPSIKRKRLAINDIGDDQDDFTRIDFELQDGDIIQVIRKQSNPKCCNRQCEDCHKMFDCPDSSVGEQL